MLPLAQESALGVKVVLGCLYRHIPPKIRALWAPKPAPCLIPRSSYFQHLLSSCKFSLCMFETNSWERFLVRIISKQLRVVFFFLCFQNMQRLSLDVSVRRGKRVHFFNAGHIYFSSHLLNISTRISCAKGAISLFYPSTGSTVELLLLK